MRITGVKSICCGEGVRPLRREKWVEDKVYLCPKCKKPCESYFCAEIEETSSGINIK